MYCFNFISWMKFKKISGSEWTHWWLIKLTGLSNQMMSQRHKDIASSRVLCTETLFPQNDERQWRIEVKLRFLLIDGVQVFLSVSDSTCSLQRLQGMMTVMSKMRKTITLSCTVFHEIKVLLFQWIAPLLFSIFAKD